MNDEHLTVGCIACERAMTRHTDRFYGMDVPDVMGDTVVGSRRVNYDYLDPTLGPISSKQDRAEKMKRAGLVDYSPDPVMLKHREEARRIRSQANPAGDIEASKAIRKEHQAADLKRRKRGIKKAFAKTELVLND